MENVKPYDRKLIKEVIGLPLFEILLFKFILSHQIKFPGMGYVTDVEMVESFDREFQIYTSFLAVDETMVHGNFIEDFIRIKVGLFIREKLNKIILDRNILANFSPFIVGRLPNDNQSH